MGHPKSKHWALLYTQVLVQLAAGYTCGAPRAMCPLKQHSRPLMSLPLPSLPEQYSVKVEANILQKQWTTEVEEHYDSVNNRASMSLTLNGSTTISIFDYMEGEKYTIYPNGSCETSRATYDVFGFTKLGKTPKPIMATINDVFRFGQGYEQVYQGKDNIRGIPVDHWTSCQEMPEVGAKYQLDYYFSDPDYTTAGGAEQVPVRAVLNGTANNMNPNMTPARGTHIFQHIYEFTSFRSGPALNEDVFAIPKGVACHGKVNTKTIPLMPWRLQVDVEVVVPSIRDLPTRVEQLRYDVNHQLVETKYTDVVPQMNGHSHATDWTKTTVVTYTVIEDFGNAVVYKINNFDETCQVSELDFTTSMETHRMTIEQLAYDPKDYVYMGETSVRQIPVDVWVGEEGGILQELYFTTNEHLDIDDTTEADEFFLTPTLVGIMLSNKTAVGYESLKELFRDIEKDLYKEKWKSPGKKKVKPTADPLPTRTSDQITWGDKMSQMFHQRITEKMVHLFRPTPIFTEMGYFDISGCYNDSQVTRIMLSVNASFEHDVALNYVLFSNSIREAIADKSGLSILQINNVFALPSKQSKNVTRLILTLLGSVHSIDKPAPQETAIEKLKKTVESKISVEVHYPQHSKTFTIASDEMDLMFNMSALIHHEPQSKTPNPISSDSYSPGAVTAIAFAALILGVALCSAVLFFIYKRKHPEESLIPYRLTE
ncbi:uncharacterized protein LOC131957189 [Physella acuta]|uniref:uncharacterized protein LOC131957189 n=1 Tax=Physella acuta TaxID=109671 RepID=UPI0027DCEF3E|nr:uncharacterized protein LOC131957189 [Physella acuta]XP_059177900.1 uncharacterized protein LOC131957189 [Physella acuta]